MFLQMWLWFAYKGVSSRVLSAVNREDLHVMSQAAIHASLLRLKESVNFNILTRIDAFVKAD